MLLCAPAIPSAAVAEAFPPIPELILGVNAGTAELDLTDEDLSRLKAIGVNTVRFTVYPELIGVPRSAFSWTAEEYAFDPDEAGREIDWSRLDAFLQLLAAHELTPYVCPHPFPAQWQTIYLPEDAERVFWYSRVIVEHIHRTAGDRVLYGWYENIWRNSLKPWGSGRFSHHASPTFPELWRNTLRRLYQNDLGRLRRAWSVDAASFDELSIPDLGTPDDVPAGIYGTRGAYDLRLVTDILSRSRLRAWRREMRSLAPGALWAGACQHGFYGMHDTCYGHQPKCNWSLRTHAQTGDMLAADTYVHGNQLGVFYRTVAKTAASENTDFLIAELNAAHPQQYDLIPRIGGPLRGVLVWCAKDAGGFGLLAEDGTPRPDRLDPLAALFAELESRADSLRSYSPGKVRVYYPEETYEYACLRRNHLDAYERVCETMPPEDLEPVLTPELETLPDDAVVFVLEKHLPSTAIRALERMGDRVVSWHTAFINENGTPVQRSTVPDDFRGRLRQCPGGAGLLEAFSRVEEKERNVAHLDLGTEVETSAEYKAEYGGNGLGNVIDGDAVASRVMFADTPQDQYIDVTLDREYDVYGAFVETAFEDPGRTPGRMLILVDDHEGGWREIAAATEISGDRIRVRFEAATTRRLRFDLGADGPGERIMELGVLAQP
jgi:hypothetical protein